MKLQRIALAIAALAVGGAVSAQQVIIQQSGSNDTATVDQTTLFGSTTYASIVQQAGAGNTASVLQGLNGSTGISARATISQYGSTGYVAKVAQIGVTDSSNVDVYQSAGSGSTVDLLQFGVSASRIRANQGGNASNILAQQSLGSSGAYIGAELHGNNGTVTVIQGQPGTGGVVSSSARVFQYGSGNDGLTVQSGITASNAYTSQGSPQMVGYYFNASAGGWIEVDKNVIPASATGSMATTFQTGGVGQSAYILQYGSTLNASVTQTGSGNLGGILQSGTGHTASITQSGIGGNATVAQYGTAQSAYVMQAGSGNTATVKQR